MFHVHFCDRGVRVVACPDCFCTKGSFLGSVVFQKLALLLNILILSALLQLCLLYAAALLVVWTVQISVGFVSLAAKELKYSLQRMQPRRCPESL